MSNNTILKNESATDFSASSNIGIIVNCVFNAVLMLIAIIGNSLVIAAIWRTPTLRTPFTTLLCSLAASDFLVGLVAQPLFIAVELKGFLYFLEKFFSFMTYGSCGVSLCTMTMISLDRFAALHYHMRYVTMVTTTRVLYTLVTIWVIIFLSLGIFFWNIILYFFIAAVVIVICLLISAFCYIRIFQIVKRHKAQIQAQQQAVQNADNNFNIMRLKKSSMNTFVFYILLIICYFPMFLNLVLMATNRLKKITRYWNVYTTIVYLNSSINPILYFWRLSDLRSAVVKTARKMFCKHTDQL